MLDFTPLRQGKRSLVDIAQPLTKANLYTLTDEMIDTELDIIADVNDQDVIFVPTDPDAQDIPWTLAHVIAHATATSEETAAQASTLARSVPITGRSRYEVPWETLRTAAQLQRRLQESRRMRHAFLNAWPDEPNLALIWELPNLGTLNAIGSFILGLSHEDRHLEQLREIMRQSYATRKK